MPAYLGRLVSVGIGRESSRGTAVNPTFWEKHDSVKIDDILTQVIDEAAAGVIEAGENGFGVELFSSWEAEVKIKDVTVGLWLLAIFGSAADAAHSGESAVYDHTYTVQESNQHQSLTISVNDPVQDYRYALGCIDTAELTFEVGKMAMLSMSGSAHAGASATLTPSMTQENYFTPQCVTYKDASTAAGLAAATAKKVKKVSIKVSKNLEPDMILSNVAPNDFFNKTFKVEGTIEALFTSEAEFKTGFLADGYRAMLLNLVNSDVVIGSAANPQLQIQLDRVKIRELSRDLGIDGIVRQTVSFTGLFNPSTSTQIKAILTNTQASYTA